MDTPVENTKGEDLDLDFTSCTVTKAGSYNQPSKIFEHLLAPFNILSQVKTDRLGGEHSFKIMVFTSI